MLKKKHKRIIQAHNDPSIQLQKQMNHIHEQNKEYSKYDKKVLNYKNQPIHDAQPLFIPKLQESYSQMYYYLLPYQQQFEQFCSFLLLFLLLFFFKSSPYLNKIEKHV